MKYSAPSTVFLILVLFTSTLPQHAQDAGELNEYPEPEQKFYLGLETGIKFFESLDPGHDFIRQQANYYDYNPYTYMARLAYAVEVAITAEYRLFRDRFWVSSGLMFAPGHSSMELSSGDQGYFYLLLDQKEQESYYYRIHSMESWEHRLGIPLNFRYSPFVPRVFRLYFKASMDVLVDLASSRKVNFHDRAMEIYEGEILGLFPESKLYAAASLGAGFQLGRQDRTQLRLEADFPSFICTPQAFSFVKNEMGIGLSLNLVVPVKSK